GRIFTLYIYDKRGVIVEDAEALRRVRSPAKQAESALPAGEHTRPRMWRSAPRRPLFAVM
ncbi:MAG: hypothetical protein NTV49_13605, partial [Kiritimatiellaeota bacterium]|nr:hypothetical protein [Kiritimatiellota bacterium]